MLCNGNSNFKPWRTRETARMAWSESPARVGYAAVIALFLLFTHRANITRLKRGNEPRFERVRVLGRLMDRGP